MIAAFRVGLESKKYPTSIITSRSYFMQTKGTISRGLKGAYLIKEHDKYKLTIIAMGTKVGAHCCLPKTAWPRLVFIVMIQLQLAKMDQHTNQLNKHEH